MSALARALETIYRLNVGVTGSGSARHERPHKPVLLLAALDAIEANEATPERILWSRPLVARFQNYFEVVKAADDDCTPRFPFSTSGVMAFGSPFGRNRAPRDPLEGAPSASDAAAGTVWARFSGDWSAIIGECFVSRRLARRDHRPVFSPT
jgi:putative restriction endonuclease